MVNLVARERPWSLDVSPKRDQKPQEVANPPGWMVERYRNTPSVTRQQDTDAQSKLVDKRSWDIALGPIKGLPMNMFMMYMVGSQISMFPIMMLGMSFFRHISAIMGLKQITKQLEKSPQYHLQTMVYVLGQLIGLGLAVNKCNSMGLLPTHPSDWLAFLTSPKRLEYTDGGLSL